MTVIRQVYVNELEGVKINIGDPMPYPIPLIFGIGKNPVVQVLKIETNGTKTQLPNTTATFEYNIDGYVSRIWINAESSEDATAVNNMSVNVYPQQYLNV